MDRSGQEASRSFNHRVAQRAVSMTMKLMEVRGTYQP